MTYKMLRPGMIILAKLGRGATGRWFTITEPDNRPTSLVTVFSVVRIETPSDVQRYFTSIGFVDVWRDDTIEIIC